jgi:hypothetical protein
MQSEFGGYKDSTTYMWVSSPSLSELVELSTLEQEDSQNELESRVLQCVSIVLAHVGSGATIREFYQKIQKSMWYQTITHAHEGIAT